MAVPVLTTRIDWENLGAFTNSPYDTLTNRVIDEDPCIIQRGRSSDFSTEAMGASRFTLDNYDDSYTPDRNWLDNPSFEVSTTGWSTAAIASLTAAATSITKVVDTSGVSTGTNAGEAVLTATINSGVTFALPWTFVSGNTYAVSVYLKSVTGNLNVRAGLASSGTPADIASSGANITTSWAQYTFTWTPSGDRTDAVFFVRTTTAATATVRIDTINVNPGASANTFIEAPTKGQLVPGRPVHIYGTYSATDYPLFYGFIERLVPDPENDTVSVVCYDVLRRFSETSVVATAPSFMQLTPREHRLLALSDYERGNRNLLYPNPSFETNLTGWTDTGGIASRLTTDAAPGAGTACMQIAATGASQEVHYNLYGVRPAWFSGEQFTFSVYLRTTAGTQTWTLLMGITGGTQTSRTVTVTSSWTRFSVTHTFDATYDDQDVPMVQILASGSGTIRADAAAVTRGVALYPYSDAGTGRWPNLVSNSSFEVSSGAGWADAWSNICTNPSFETNTTGWAVTADSFHTAATSITRSTGGTQKFGTAHGDVAVTGSGQGAHYAVTGTFVAGTTYKFSIWALDAGAGNVKVFIGSNGTPADSVTSGSLAITGSYQEYTLEWTPSSNRTDVHVGIFRFSAVSDTISIDGIYIYRLDAAGLGGYPAYSDVGPGNGTAGSFVTSNTLVSTPVQYGAQSCQTVTPATTGAGRVYDFARVQVKFRGSQSYNVSVWLRSTTAMPYKVGIGANKGDGTWDEASTTGTLSSNTWTQVTVNWTPSADRSAANAWDVVLYVMQTNATGRTFFLDGIRVIPGSSSDSFEMSQWQVPATAEDEAWAASAQFSGSLFEVLTSINDLNLSRHWIKPTMTSPFYTYVLEDRDTFAAKSVAEDTGTNGLDGWADTDVDRATIVNIVPVRSLIGATTQTDYIQDEDSITRYGERPYQLIDGATLWGTSQMPVNVGNALIARYKHPRIRPRSLRVNVFPNMLQRDLNDVIEVSFPRFLLSDQRFCILTSELSIDGAGGQWKQELILEEYPF